MTENPASDREGESHLIRTAADATPRRWTRTVPAEHIDAELSDLWREVSQAGGPKARSLMSNLIVYAESDLAQADPEELAEVSRLHPSRVILIWYKDRATPRSDIEIRTHGEGVAQFGVEHITVEIGDRDAVPSLLRRLTVGDLPTSICWGASALPSLKIVQNLAPLGRQFLYDSAVWPNPLEAIRTLAPIGSRGTAGLDVADLSWRRLKLLRHAIVQAVDPTVLDRPIGALHGMTIEAGPGQLAPGWLLGGWIASRLGWQPISRNQSDSGTAVTFTVPDGRATLHVRPVPEDTLRVSFETDAVADKPALHAAHEADEIVVRYGWDVPPLSLVAPRQTRAALLAAELRNLYVDSYLRDALTTVARIETLRT